MNAKTAAVIGACSVFGTIAFSKYQIFLSKMSARKAQVPKKSEVITSSSPGEPPFPLTEAQPRIQAQDFFANAG
ncbi:MAG: hypothetical protein KGL39_33220 [Patescibacteria group bacterium]|nr:hypothetical protein [Patescibacteria group bacterium]